MRNIFAAGLPACAPSALLFRHGFARVRSFLPFVFNMPTGSCRGGRGGRVMGWVSQVGDQLKVGFRDVGST